METNIFDIFSAIFIRTCGKKILKQLYLHTAFIRLLLVEACLFIEIVTVATSYGGTFSADDMCKAMFSFSILSFIFIAITILVCVDLALVEDPLRRKKRKKRMPEIQEITRTRTLMKTQKMKIHLH